MNVISVYGKYMHICKFLKFSLTVFLCDCIVYRYHALYEKKKII